MPHHNDYYDKHDTLIIPHALFGSLCALILVPASLIIARYYRTSRFWFKVHAVINTTVVLLIMITFVLGTQSISKDQLIGKSADPHHQLGLATFCFVAFQGILGWASHWTKSGKPEGLPAPGKSWVRYFHVFFGIGTAGVLYACVYSGYHEWTKASDTGTATPLGVRVVYWILFGIAVPVYLAGFYFARNKSTAPAGPSPVETATPEKEKELELQEA